MFEACIEREVSIVELFGFVCSCIFATQWHVEDCDVQIANRIRVVDYKLERSTGFDYRFCRCTEEKIYIRCDPYLIQVFNNIRSLLKVDTLLHSIENALVS